jgi:hypothetical protein
VLKYLTDELNDLLRRQSQSNRCSEAFQGNFEAFEVIRFQSDCELWSFGLIGVGSCQKHCQALDLPSDWDASEGTSCVRYVLLDEPMKYLN